MKRFGFVLPVLAAVALAGCGQHREPTRSFVSDQVLQLSEATWPEQVLKSDRPVLVVFSASWCQPCRTYAPVVESIAGKLAGQVVVGKVDADRYRGLVRSNAVSGLPTTILFDRGKEVGRFVGAQSATDVSRWLAVRGYGFSAEWPDG